LQLPDEAHQLVSCVEFEDALWQALKFGEVRLLLGKVLLEIDQLFEKAVKRALASVLAL
jgi:hypothetical protein